ncbi:putative transmembrane protein 14 [Catenaria anguillulae PL171]|uniref:Putative transmembrane protein 14 n=1 Tax=Catenaria anguillulae PL171 TaxID=765915 RepID=A0A1Y2H896_9FUNG|nr:putative transmembrane protein 14 [Catenaria anguillulae PL171]
MSHHPSVTLAAVCTVGGTIGYLRQGSRPSLIAGVTLGAAYATAAYLLKNNLDYGTELALGTSLVLTAAMAPKAIRGRKPHTMVMGAAGTLATAYYGKKMYEWRVGV